MFYLRVTVSTRAVYVVCSTVTIRTREGADNKEEGRSVDEFINNGTEHRFDLTGQKKDWRDFPHT